MTAAPNDSSLDRNTFLYIVALREQLSGNSLKLLTSFYQASLKFLSSFCGALIKSPPTAEGFLVYKWSYITENSFILH